MVNFNAINANTTTKKRYLALSININRVFMFTSLFSLLLSLTGCNPGGEMVNPEGAAGVNNASGTRVTAIIDSNTTLKSVATFPIGAAPSSGIIVRSPKAYNYFISNFNSKTIHAYMKNEPVRGQFDFKELDYWVKLAETNPMRLHGHCLVYHAGAPDWLNNFSGTTADFELAVKNHIQTLVGRYKGKIKGWDVTNEIYEDNPPALRQSAFRKLYSSDAAYIDFIKRCFHWAHAADPDALLFLSDYGLELSAKKVRITTDLINDFKRSGVPIHGYSPHMHISISTPDAGIANALRQLSATGLQIHISELDIKINPENNQNIVFSDQLLTAQRLKYQTVARAYKQLVPKGQQYGITLWDFSDADSWIVRQQKKNDAPCIFNTKYDKKPAFYGLMEGLMN